MKNLYSLSMMLCLCMTALAQLPPQQWARQYGGSDVDIPFSIKITSDGGSIAAGYTDSKNGDVSPQPNREYWDLWVVKLDRCGTIQWERSFGGTNYESARDVVQTADGGYIVAGETNSTDGGVVSGYGGTKDIWILRLSPAGTLLWQKRYGGNGLDIANRIYLNADGSFYLAASSSSNDGNITGNHGTAGYTDGVLMKLDAAGNLLWSRCFGGSKNEEFFAIEVINGRTYLAGFANSVDGDIPPQQKNYDVWLLALDANGNKIYSKVYGGSQNDVAYSMTRGNDGSLTLAGYTTSTDGDVSGARGSQDYWVININPANGNKKWQKVLGGTDADYASTVMTDADGGYIVGGIAYSSDGDVSNPLGQGDYWVVKLSSDGKVVWKQNIGGTGNDNLRSMAFLPSAKEYFLCGDSDSGNGDFGGGQGDVDFGIIKLKQLDTLTVDSTVCSLNGFVPPTDTLRDICGNDSAYVTYKPVIIGGPFDGLKKTDTIFVGEKLQLPSVANGNITWNSDPTLSCTDCPHPIASPTVTTVYTATNSLAAGCQRSDQFTLVVLKDAVINIPSAFTPNGDGLNDWFGPLGKVPKEYSIQIFDRNGTLFFKSNSTYTKWDGRINGVLQPNGIYVYLVQYKDMKGNMVLKKGTVALLR
ncbi:MAG: gliding motility-associated C-terminal domain-containing protein [Chitinophagaceae bacterium]